MRRIVDPNELLPLTELANRTLQDRLRKVPEFATSIHWRASAVVVGLNESMGFNAQVGFELRTPLDDPFQDALVAWGANAEEAVRNAVAEWLELALPAALAIHSDKDTAARLGWRTQDGWLYGWRLAEGIPKAVGEDAAAILAELKNRPLFERLNLAAALPLHQERPWFCLKLRLARAADGALTADARLNDESWPPGVDLLQRFTLPGTKPLDLRQYLFLRRTDKRPAHPVSAAPAAGAQTLPPTGKKPWWKAW
jgi:hypothetical protein